MTTGREGRLAVGRALVARGLGYSVPAQELQRSSERDDLGFRARVTGRWRALASGDRQELVPGERQGRAPGKGGRSLARRVPLLEGVDLRVGAGEVVGLTGRSGAGKSSLAGLLSGLLEPDAGTVSLGEEPVRDVRSAAGAIVRGRIGMVNQSPRAAMDGRLRLSRSIALAAAQGAKRTESGAPAGSADLPIEELADTLGLSARLLARRPHEVSDGQLQRAALLRTFAHRPEVVICDEATAALDPIASAAVMAALQRFAHVGGRGVLVISHDLALVDAIADRVVALADRRMQDRPRPR